MVREGPPSECSCFWATDILHIAWLKSRKVQLTEITSRPSNISSGDGYVEHDKRGFLRQPPIDGSLGIALEPPKLGSFDTSKFLVLVRSLPFLGDREKTLMEGLASTAQSLRSLCVIIAQSPWFEKLSEDSYSDGSPLDTLVYVAHFLESVVTFPLWDHMSMANLERSMETVDPHIKLSSSELRSKWDGVQHRLSHGDGGDLRQKVVASSPHLSLPVSTPQILVSNIKQLWRSEEDSDDKMKFGDAEEPQHQENPQYSLSILPRRLHACTSRGHVKFTEDPTERYLKLKSMILAYGYRIAFSQIIIAIIINHNRAIFYPWLGVDIWQNPMGQLRLARSNPEVFLDEFHSFRWIDMVFCVLQRAACEALASLALKFAISGSTYGEPGKELGPRCFIWGLLYLVWILTAVEYIFSRCVNSCAIMTAVWKLAASKCEGCRIAFDILTEKHWLKMRYVLLTMLLFILDTVLPICKDSLRSAVNGQLGPSLFFGFIAFMVKAVIVYRSVFFIPLEIGGMFVAAGWATVGFWILCTWFFDDPLGLQLSRALARFRGERARIQIERGEVDASLMMGIWYEGFPDFLSDLDAARRKYPRGGR